MTRVAGYVLVLTLGCGGGHSAKAGGLGGSPAATEVAKREAEALPGAECESGVTPAEAQEAFAQGRRLLEESREGEHHRQEGFAEAQDALYRAALGGHLEAQYLYGSSVFSATLQHDDFDGGSAFRAPMVRALTFLRLAALRGYEPALQYMPDLDAAKLSGEEPPLSEVPESWLEEASAEADRRFACMQP